MADNTNVKRIEEERHTVGLMIALYCGAHHKTSGTLCDGCRALFDYASARLMHCRFGKDKPVCNKCRVHCYKPEMRERICEVMRYAGPRMLFRHPVAAVKHLIRGLIYKT